MAPYFERLTQTGDTVSAVGLYFITGVSSGIGRELAREVVRRGHRVWGVARRRERLVEMEKQLGLDRFSFSVCDVSRQEDIQSTAEAMEKAGYLPDVVILNAGINLERSDTPFRIEMFEKVIRVNLFGALSWVEVFLPAFRARRGGRFAAISSMAAYRGDARWVAYPASKAAVARAFEAFRGRHTREGVGFTTIHLGQVETGMGVTRSPFRLTEGDAARKVLLAIERGVTSVTIPRGLRAVVELMRVLPDSLFSYIILRAFSEPLEERDHESTDLEIGTGERR